MFFSWSEKVQLKDGRDIPYNMGSLFYRQFIPSERFIVIRDTSIRYKIQQ